MAAALPYLLRQFEKVRLLHETPRGEVWLGTDRMGRPVITAASRASSRVRQRSIRSAAILMPLRSCATCATAGGTTVMEAGERPADGKDPRDADVNGGAAENSGETIQEHDGAGASTRGEIRARYYFNGRQWNAWTEAIGTPVNNANTMVSIPATVWSTWEGDEAARIFPSSSEWQARVHVMNTTQETFDAPVLHMECEDGAEMTARDYDAPPLTPGGSIDFDIPLSGLRIAAPENGSGRPMTLELRGIGHEIFGAHSTIEFVPKK